MRKIMKKMNKCKEIKQVISHKIRCTLKIMQRLILLKVKYTFFANECSCENATKGK